MSTDNRAWYAVKVIFRREKHLVKILQSYGYDAWIPIIKKIRKYQTKRRIVDLPLITQYIFVKIIPEEYTQILKFDGVIAFLKNDGVLKPVKDEEIAILKRVSGEEREISITSENLEQGDIVEIIGGELTGLQGELIHFKGKNRVAIALESLGSHLLIDVPIEQIHKLTY